MRVRDKVEKTKQDQPIIIMGGDRKQVRYKG